MPAFDQIDHRLLGARLREARNAIGQTQQDAAVRLDLPKATLSAIEAGERPATPGQLLHMAALYHCSVARLVGRPVVVENFLDQFRTSEAELLDIGSVLESIATNLQHRAEDYVALERLNGVAPNFSYPPPYEIPAGSPEQAAEEIAAAERARMRLGDGPIGALRQRLESDIGLRLFYYPMPGNVVGAYAYHERLGGCIGINTSHPHDQRHWTLAHEYGHFLLHRNHAEITVVATGRPVIRERLADAFAASFLMPTSGLNARFSERRQAAEHGITLGDVVGLADLYRVPLQAMVLRLEELRRVTGGTWAQLQSEGFRERRARQQLGLDAEPPLHELFPRRYVNLAVQAFRRGDLTEGQLARYLYTDRISAREQVEEVERRISSAQEGEFAQLALDLNRPLEAR